MWRYVKKDSYGFISILQLLQNIDDTFPWVKVTARYLTTVSYRDILFCGLKNCKALSVKVNYLSYFLQNSSSMILVIQCFFYKILYVYQYRKIPSLFECIFCKQIYRGLKSSWLYFVFLWLVFYLEFYGTSTIIQKRVSLIFHLDQIENFTTTL